MKVLKYFARYIFLTLGILSGLLIFYLITAYGLSRITVNTNYLHESTDTPVTIFLMTNGIHTDIVLPLTTDLIDWTNFVNPGDTKSRIGTYNYVGFGWGDKEFYLETPVWEDLKFQTAFKALFFLGSGAMHISFYPDLKESPDCKKINISKDSYKLMIDYITNSFKQDNNLPILIKGASYGHNDLFYEATGTFNLFFTCNTWANNGLKHAKLKACFWTLFDKGILNKY